MPKTPLKLGYWQIRGLGQSIRYLLNYAGADYVERTYTFGDKFTRDDWLKEKFTLGLDFPNIPYLIDGDVRLTQSLAILRYLARKYGLMPQSDDDWLRASVIEQQVNDMLWENVRLCYDPSYDNDKKEAFLKTFYSDRLPALVKFLGDRKFFAGDQLSYVDFLAYEMFDQHRTLWPEERKALEKYPTVVEYLKRMESLPRFKAYLSSDKFMDWPVWSEMSAYGGPKMAKPA
ncbi:glutathione S-transferase Mu 1-like [Ornithodoros turicata]